MAVQIGATPDSGFDDPIGMLTDCHRRIEHFLDILCVVAVRATGRSMTEEETAAVQTALQYFHVGGQRHNADEEQSLFPRLRASAGSEELGEIQALETDHQDANSLHEEVQDLCEKWVGAGALEAVDQDRLLSATQKLKRLYTEHIRLEEQVVFPRAGKLLSRAAIDAIGQEFRARRE
ncbi:MAG TPA: hemerythrin domain-containing protein [Terracidiphilus sp.]|jgi:hemerythrin-like domain-containing protein